MVNVINVVCRWIFVRKNDDSFVVFRGVTLKKDGKRLSRTRACRVLKRVSRSIHGADEVGSRVGDAT